jgi:sialic acid synthase SpsE/CMP-N-acetylneuraminic acid synthetase
MGRARNVASGIGHEATECKMKTLCVILARAGSKGLPGKNVMPIAGRPMIAWTIDHAQAATCIDRIVVSTDGEAIAQAARAQGVEVIMRPAGLAGDTATVDAAARHAVQQIEDRASKIEEAVILYSNVPVRPADLIDRAVAKRRDTGCDSVQSVCPVGKMHPYWQKKLVPGREGEHDVIEPFIENAVYRRQDLPPVYQLDGGIIVVRREALFTERDGQPHAFLGTDRRAIVTEPGSVIDVDDMKDAAVAEAVLGKSQAGSGKSDVVIAGKMIGGGQPTYIIAELGVNHDGLLPRALELVRAAKDGGADAVKLQLFDPDLLLSAEAELAAYQQTSATDPHAMLRSLQLSVEQMLTVKALAHELGMGFIVTPFSVENYPAMQQLDVDAVKIASPDCVNTPLIETMQKLGKPLIISTGASDMAELVAMAPVWRRSPCALMACISAYPVPSEAGFMAVSPDLFRFGLIVGYSDHEIDHPHSGEVAVMAGACLLEKHLTYDRTAAGPDHAASLDPKGFAGYVSRIRRREMLGEPDKHVLDCEQDVRRVSRQSVCAVRDLKAGEVIQRSDVTVKRPGTGIAAAKLGDVIGKALQRDVKANHLLHEGDV